MRWLYYTFLSLASLGFIGLIGSVAFIAFVISHYGKDLPDHSQLKTYEPPIVTRIYAGDGNLMAEYAQEKRVFMPIEAIPERVKQAFIAAEDQNFYDHTGVDVIAIGRAAVTNVKNAGTGRRLIGASTITQQVVKNFLLSNEVSYERKIKEAILAMRMEKALSKDQILELYLNEIYLGQRAYGVAAAALIYFDKSLDDLTLSEAAYLAALPKAPNNYHPVRDYEAAISRRNWVLDRMAEDGHITDSQAELAKAAPLMMQETEDTADVDDSFFAEEVRRELEKKYGPESLYQGGLVVRTSLDPHLQKIAVQTLRDGLMAYDKRHGWRGPVTTFESNEGWTEKLRELEDPKGILPYWQLAVVLESGSEKARLGFEDNSEKEITLEGVKWARKCTHDCYGLGPEIEAVSQVLSKGDVVMVEDGEDGLVLRQIPLVQGAIVALDPHTGRVLAMQGGWTHSTSVFNRATQAKRQPGSAFKPFIYLEALSEGFTPATLVLDAPFVIEQAPGDYWRPSNYSGEFYGPTPIRVGVEKSRNLMTVRLADHVGMDKIVETAENFGIAEEMKPFLSYALGAGETTLLRLTSAYAMLVNGGKKVTPTFVDRIQDRHGKTIFSDDERPCANCGDLIRWESQNTPMIPDTREQVADERNAYQVVSILEGVIQRGTGRRIAELGRPLAGKTGTTNESKDTWFIGFSPDLVVGVFAGFDDPRSLGKRETGSSVAAPIFKDFMQEALGDTPPIPFRVPPGVKHVRINAETGRAARPGDDKVIWEAFVSGTEPNVDDYVLDTNIISGGGLVDPYAQNDSGYEQFGYGDFSGGYDAPYNDNVYRSYSESSSFSPYPDNSNVEVNPEFMPASDNGQRRQPQSQQQPESTFSGTGGLY